MSSPARTPAAAKAERKNLGRQKIKMEKIKNPDHLNVTFSKRRSGLFKKAHELSIMTGAEVALVCFSPAGKAFSYGSPDLAHVANRFENGGGPAPPSTMATQMNDQLNQMEKQLEDEKKKMEDLDKKDTEFNRRCWWREENLPPHIGLEEVERMRDAMEDLKLYLAEQEKLVAEQEKLVAEQEAAAAASNPPMELYGKYLNMGGADPFAAGPSSAMALLAEQAAAAAASNPPVDLYGNYLTRGGPDPFACGPSSMMALLTEQGAAASHFPMDQYGNYVPSGGADPFAAGPSSAAAAGASSSNSQFQHGGGRDYGFGQRGPH